MVGGTVEVLVVATVVVVPRSSCSTVSDGGASVAGRSDNSMVSGVVGSAAPSSRQPTSRPATVVPTSITPTSAAT